MYHNVAPSALYDYIVVVVKQLIKMAGCCEGLRSKKQEKLYGISAKTLTLVAEKQELRRYHLHGSHVQKAMSRAARKKIKKISQKR